MTSTKRKLILGIGVAFAVCVVTAGAVMLYLLNWGANQAIAFSSMHGVRHEIERVAALDEQTQERQFPLTLSGPDGRNAAMCPACETPFSYAPTFDGQRLQINGEPNRIVLWSECDHLDGRRVILRQNLAIDVVGYFDIDWLERTVKPKTTQPERP